MRRLLPALTLLAVLALAPAGAHAYRTGFSEQQSDMFLSPLFKPLKTKQARLIVSYDAVLRGTDEVDKIDTWLANARQARVEPLIAFNYSRGCFDNGKIPRRSSCKLASVSRYTKAFKAFRARYPTVKVFSPWNEANHFSQPTDKNPRRAAQYYNVVKANCRGCKIVAADVLDEGDVAKWLATFQRYAKGKPRIWGGHNYSDTNRFRNRGTRRILKATQGQLWLTETGGVVKFASFEYDEQRAAKALRYMFKLAGSSSRITRLYIYQWSGAEQGARFDAGVVGPDGDPRPGYYVVRKQLTGR